MILVIDDPKQQPLLRFLQRRNELLVVGLDLLSNHIEGSRLTHDQTRYIYETNTIGATDESVNEDLKLFYYRGLKEWGRENGYLADTMLTAQDRFKKYLDYFRIPYSEKKRY